MAVVIHVEQTLYDSDKKLIADHPYSWEQTMTKDSDSYKKLIGDGNAKVAISINERIGGPYGYSSVGVNILVTVTCNQDENTIRAAEKLAFNEVAEAMDSYLPKAHQILCAHLGELYKDDR